MFINKKVFKIKKVIKIFTHKKKNKNDSRKSEFKFIEITETW